MAEQNIRRKRSKHRTPWRVQPKIGTHGRAVLILNCDGGLICECDYADRAAYIVECVNACDATP